MTAEWPRGKVQKLSVSYQIMDFPLVIKNPDNPGNGHIDEFLFSILDCKVSMLETDGNRMQDELCKD